jgi:hypothetical protein
MVTLKAVDLLPILMLLLDSYELVWVRRVLHSPGRVRACRRSYTGGKIIGRFNL